MIWIWLGVVVSLLLIEYMSRNFTAICFAISGIISCILTHFNIKFNFKVLGHKVYLSPYIVQLLVFLVVGIFLILIIRPLFLNFLEKKKQEKIEKKEKLKKEKENNKKSIDENVKKETSKNKTKKEKKKSKRKK